LRLQEVAEKAPEPLLDQAILPAGDEPPDPELVTVAVQVVGVLIPIEEGEQVTEVTEGVVASDMTAT